MYGAGTRSASPNSLPWNSRRANGHRRKGGRGYPMAWILLAAALVGGAVLFAIVGTLGARRFIRGRVSDSHKDVLAPIFLTAGVIYAVLLGFMVIAVWQAYDTARANTAEEASLLVPLYRQTMAMPTQRGDAMRVLIRRYAQWVTSGWTQFQATGQGSGEGRKAVDAMLRLFDTLTPATKAGEISAAQFYQTLSQLLLDRDKRLLEGSESLSWVMWLAALGGGVVTVGMSFVLYMDHPMPHVVMTSVLAALIGLLLLIMAILDHPFVGPVAITPEPFQASLRLFDLIDGDFR
jgi:Protein of unknown function (DUF4239)